MKNTPPERLLKINMQGYVLQSIGIIVVCTILVVTRSMWWLIFVFLFALWNNYSGFVSAYKQYTQVYQLRKELKLVSPEVKSPHLKKAMMIKDKFGKKAGWVSAIIAAAISLLIVNPLTARWYFKLLYIIMLPVFYYFFYFVIFFKLSRRLKNE